MSKLELRVFVSLIGLPNNLLEIDKSNKNPRFLQFMGINRQRKREFVSPNKHQLNDRELKQFNQLKSLYYREYNYLAKERFEILYYYSNSDVRRGLFWQKVEFVSKSKQIPLSPKHSITSRYESLDYILFHNFDENFLQLKFDEQRFNQFFNFERIRHLIPDQEQFREELFSFLMLWEQVCQNLEQWNTLSRDKQLNTVNVIFAMSSITTHPGFIVEAIKQVPAVEKEFSIITQLNSIFMGDFDKHEKLFFSELEVWLMKQKSDEQSENAELENTIEEAEITPEVILEQELETISDDHQDNIDHLDENLNATDIFEKLQALAQRATSADGIDLQILANAYKMSNLLEHYLNQLDSLKTKCRDLLEILIEYFNKTSEQNKILWLNQSFIDQIDSHLTQRIREINVTNRLIYFRGQLGDMIKYSEIIVDLIIRNIDEFSACQMKVQDIVSQQLLSAPFAERQAILSQLEDHYAHMHTLTKMQNNLEQDLHCLIFNFVHFDEERYKNAMTPEEFQAKFGIVREKLSHTVSENLLSSRLPRSLIEHLPKTSKRLLDAVRSSQTESTKTTPNTHIEVETTQNNYSDDKLIEIEDISTISFNESFENNNDNQYDIEKTSNTNAEIAEQLEFLEVSTDKEISTSESHISILEPIETNSCEDRLDSTISESEILISDNETVEDDDDHYSFENTNNINILAHDIRENSENSNMMNALIWQLIIRHRRSYDNVLAYHLSSAWDNYCIEHNIENVLLLPPALIRAISLKPYISSYYDEVAMQFKKSIEHLLPIKDDTNKVLNLMILGTIAKPALLYPDSGLHEYLSQIQLKSKYVYEFTQTIQNFSMKHYPLSVELISQIANYLHNKKCMHEIEEYVIAHNDLDLVTPNFSYVPAGKILKYWKNKDQIIEELLRPIKNRDYSIRTLEELKQKCARLKIHSVVEKHISETFKIIQETKNEPLLAESNQKLHFGLRNIVTEVEKWTDFYIEEHQHQWKYNQSFIETEHLINALQEIHQPLIQELEGFKSGADQFLVYAIDYCIQSINNIISLFTIDVNKNQLYASTPVYAYQDILNNILLKTTLWLNVIDKSINYQKNTPENILHELVQLVEVDLTDSSFDWTDVFRNRNSMGDHQMTLKTLEYLRLMNMSSSLISSLEIKRMKDVKEWSSELLNTLKKHSTELSIVRQKIQSLNHNQSLIAEVDGLEEHILLYIDELEDCLSNYNQPINFNEYKELIAQVAEKINELNCELEDISNEKKF